ncbi:UDP-N-acetylmuramoyl-L-alanyl-D-glutamate--2,6-diaminopimelate ligase [Piscinibacter sakaiensis]|uniref:UDP-N-acetylmuramoyl-L-alanyl-D-glutamate--2, 6-diaminopimelate ligase n=1 Tax=Piscinibacter sakaiensis TaxID=1547922 RepID=UPI003AABB0D0
MAVPQLNGIADILDWLRQRGASGLCSDSRRIAAGDAFIAWPGQASDARVFVDAALAAGAVGCIVEADGVDAFAFDGRPQIAVVAGLKAISGEIAAAFYQQPSDALQLLAVTGTNGKTSTTWWLAQALNHVGRRCGVIGTLGVGIPPELVPTGLTTPDPVGLQHALRRFADDGIDACAIEASSIGIEEQRLAGTRIAVALLTNFSQDHLDYHGDMDSYWRAKRRLFDWPGLRAAVINLDDPKGPPLAAELAGGALDLWTYSAGSEGRLTAGPVGHGGGGLAFDVREAGESVPVHSSLIGDFNVSNLLAVIGGLRALGIPLADAALACASLGAVPGRMQRIDGPSIDAPLVVVDYAHSPDAIDKVLTALQPLAAARSGVLWCVFGCGGNRDRRKRPLMAATAERLAGKLVVTSDNPRHEEPAAIIGEVVAGLAAPEQAAVIEDRAAAIAWAVQNAAAADVVLLAGKGHENYQEIGDRRLPFSDAELAAEQLQRRGGAAAVEVLQ